MILELDTFRGHARRRRPHQIAASLPRPLPARTSEGHCQRDPSQSADRESGDEASAILGQGIIDFKAFLAAAERVGVKHHYLEDEHPHAAHQIPKILKYLRRMCF